MFEGAFSFRGRIGRLNYLLGNLVLLPIGFVGVIAAGVMVATAQRTAASLVVFAVLGLMVAVGLIWYSLSLQVRRIRDIGWDPFIVLGAFVFLLVVDKVVAAQVPSLAFGKSGTAFGALLNLGLTLALLCWPGGDGDDDYASGSASRLLEPEPDAALPFASPAPALAAASPRGIAVPRKTFGKRGVR